MAYNKLYVFKVYNLYTLTCVYIWETTSVSKVLNILIMLKVPSCSFLIPRSFTSLRPAAPQHIPRQPLMCVLPYLSTHVLEFQVQSYYIYYFVYSLAFFTKVVFWNQHKLYLEKKMAIHSSIFAWRIPWTKKPGRLQSMGVTKSRKRLSD